MAKKKRPEPPPRPPQFHTTPFSALKGVVTAPPVVTLAPTPPAPVAPVEDDAEVFLQAMGGVRKLDATAPRTAAPGKPEKQSPPGPVTARTKPAGITTDELFLQEISRLKLEVRFTDTVPDEDELKPLSGNRLRQLKRGVVSVDYQLDLHGLTRDEAMIELPRFLRTARTKGQTAVLVITGKGNNSTGEPVLQQAVAAWLRDAGRELVLEFAPAPREMGGSGAFVVFLRPAMQAPK